MVQVDEGPWETCAPSAATPGLYTAPWAPALLDDTSRRPDHLLKAKNKRKTTIFHTVLRIWDVYPGSDFFPSRIRTVSIPDPGSASKNLRILTPKKWFLSSRKYDPGCSSRIPAPDADFLPIPDPGSRGHKSTGSRIWIRNTAFIYHYMFLAWAMRCAKNELYRRSQYRAGRVFLEDLRRNRIAKAIFKKNLN
jgi:hypothetical protein